MGRVCGEVIAKIMYTLVANILLSQTAKRSHTPGYMAYGYRQRIRPLALAISTAMCVRKLNV